MMWVAAEMTGPFRPLRSRLFAADARQLGPVDPEAQVDGEGEAYDARDVGQRKESESGNMLGNKERKNECEDGSDFARLNEHG